MWGWLTILRFECSWVFALCAAQCSIVCSNGVETEAMLEHGGTAGRSCYKTCHSLSSSRQQPMLPRFSCNIQKDVHIQRPGTGSYVLANMDKLDMEQCFCFLTCFGLDIQVVETICQHICRRCVFELLCHTLLMVIMLLSYFLFHSNFCWGQCIFQHNRFPGTFSPIKEQFNSLEKHQISKCIFFLDRNSILMPKATFMQN